MRRQLPKLARKLPYYLASLVGLARIARVRSIARCLVSRDKRLDLRDGHTLRLSTTLDLLVVEETLVDDVYGLRDLAATSGMIVDVGAGIGEFALAAAGRFPALRVLSYEPNPDVFELLVANARGYGYANVQQAALAIGTETSYVLHGRSSGPRATAAPAAPAADAIVVPARRLDEVVPDEPIRLLKIDCEGLELDVLASAAGVVERVDRVAVEFHRWLLPDADRAVAGLLEAYGFRTRIHANRFDADLGYVHADRDGRGVLPGARGP